MAHRHDPPLIPMWLTSTNLLFRVLHWNASFATPEGKTFLGEDPQTPIERGCFIWSSFNKHVQTLPGLALRAFRLFGPWPGRPLLTIITGNWEITIVSLHFVTPFCFVGEWRFLKFDCYGIYTSNNAVLGHARVDFWWFKTLLTYGLHNKICKCGEIWVQFRVGISASANIARIAHIGKTGIGKHYCRYISADM